MESDLIWYVSYGSNLYISRFMCYIKGGVPEGTTTDYPGCTNKTPPKADKQFIIPYELYFSKKSETWGNKGVAFIKSKRSETASTLGRMYLITKQQFIETVRQENKKRPADQTINIDFDKTILHGESEIPPMWYGRIIFLGNIESYPIFTFTARWNDRSITYNEPSEDYLRIMIRGIKERYTKTDQEIAAYFMSLHGIKEKISGERIKQLVSSIEP